MHRSTPDLTSAASRRRRLVWAVTAILATVPLAACGSSSSSSSTTAKATTTAPPSATTNPAAATTTTAAAATTTAASATTTAPAATTTVAAAPGAVTIKDFAFLPSVTKVKIGDKVTWTNSDDVDHLIAGDNDVFRSDALSGGDSFSFTFKTAGTFPYICGIHVTMRGTVEVTG